MSVRGERVLLREERLGKGFLHIVRYEESGDSNVRKIVGIPFIKEKRADLKNAETFCIEFAPDLGSLNKKYCDGVNAVFGPLTDKQMQQHAMRRIFSFDAPLPSGGGSPELLNEIFNVFKTAFGSIESVHNLAYFDNENWTITKKGFEKDFSTPLFSVERKHLELSKTKADPLVRGFAALVLSAEPNVDLKDALAIAENHITQTKDYDLSIYKNIHYYLRPFDLMFGEEEFNLTRSARVACAYLSVTQPTLSRDKSFRDFYARVFRAKYDPTINKETIIGDIDIDYNYDFNTIDGKDIEHNSYTDFFSDKLPFVNLPVHQKEFRDYLLTLSISDVEKLFGEVRQNMKPVTAIALSERILATKPREKQLELHAELCRVVLSQLALLDDSDLFNKVSYSLIEGFQNHHSMNLLLDYFTEVDVSKVEAGALFRQVLLLVDSPVTGISEKWTEPSLIDSVVSLLRKHFTAQELVTLIYHVADSEYVLSYPEWLRYEENVNEYKNVPIEWWVPLVKESAESDS